MSKIDWDSIYDSKKRKLLEQFTAKELAKDFTEKSEGFFQEQIALKNNIPFELENAKSRNETFKNPPDKRIIHHKSLLISPEAAILEFLDNIFDSYIKNIKKGFLKHHLEIEIVFYNSQQGEKCLMIKDNSGGINKKDLESLLTIGKTSESSLDKVGTWGEAFLNSILGLGESAKIYTWYITESQIFIPIEKEFFKPDTKWSLEPRYYQEKGIVNLDKGTTKIIIENIHSNYHTNEKSVYISLKKIIEDTYWKKVNKINDLGRSVELKIKPYQNEILFANFVQIDFAKLFTYFPYCPPIKVRNYIIKVKNKQGEIGEIIVDGYCGLNLSVADDEEYSRYKGVWMWGNDRLFAFNKTDEEVGFGSDTGIPSTIMRRTARHLTIMLFFKTTDSKWNEFIPWMSPDKRGFNPKAQCKKEVLDLIKILSNRFLYAIKTMKGPEFQLRIFTHSFVNLDHEEKIKEINDSRKGKNKNFFPSIWSEEDIEKECETILSLDESKFRIHICASIDELNSTNKELNESFVRYNALITQSKKSNDILPNIISNFVELGFLDDEQSDFLAIEVFEEIETGSIEESQIEEEESVELKETEQVKEIAVEDSEEEDTLSELNVVNQKTVVHVDKIKQITNEQIKDLKDQEPNIKISLEIDKKTFEKIKKKIPKKMKSKKPEEIVLSILNEFIKKGFK